MASRQASVDSCGSCYPLQRRGLLANIWGSVDKGTAGTLQKPSSFSTAPAGKPPEGPKPPAPRPPARVAVSSRRLPSSGPRAPRAPPETPGPWGLLLGPPARLGKGRQEEGVWGKYLALFRSLGRLGLTS